MTEQERIESENAALRQKIADVEQQAKDREAQKQAESRPPVAERYVPRVSMLRWLVYALTAQEAADITTRRLKKPSGSQSDHGEPVKAGDVFPLLVVRVKASTEADRPFVSGQVFLDGNDHIHVTGKLEGDGAGCWAWPTRL